MSRIVATGVLLLVASAAGCTGTTDPQAATASTSVVLSDPTTTSHSSTPSGQASTECVTNTQPEPAPGGIRLPEAELVPDGLDGWALLFPREPPWPQDEQAKVVWKVDGEGELTAVALGPSGERVEPEVLTPQGSNWDRPGDEWGSLWAFPRPGCWQLRVTRNGDSASFDVLIV